MKTVEIIKSTKDLYWYHNKIGQYFNIIDVVTNINHVYDHETGNYILEKSHKYTVLDENSDLRSKTIDTCDCREITVSDKIKKIIGKYENKKRICK